MKEPKRLLSHGATDFERQLLRAVSTERPSALLRSRMQRSLGLVGPLAWASNVKAMFGSIGSKVTSGKVAVGVAVAGLVVAGGVAGYQLMPGDEAAQVAAPAVIEAPRVAEVAAPQVAEVAAPQVAEVAAPQVATVEATGVAAAPPVATDDSEDGRLREEIALLDSVKAALQRGEREQARQTLDTYRERFPDGILRREATVLRQRAEAKLGRGSDGSSGASN